MVNVLGEHVAPLLELMAQADEAAAQYGVAAKVHLYGKKDAVKKRKMGHVNVLAENTDKALNYIEATNIWKV
ncbi:phosphoribosylaminoimidazole carboxylase ATPase subunit [compost metagenome]